MACVRRACWDHSDQPATSGGVTGQRTDDHWRWRRDHYDDDGDDGEDDDGDGHRRRRGAVLRASPLPLPPPTCTRRARGGGNVARAPRHFPPTDFTVKFKIGGGSDGRTYIVVANGWPPGLAQYGGRATRGAIFPRSSSPPSRRHARPPRPPPRSTMMRSCTRRRAPDKDQTMRGGDASYRFGGGCTDDGRCIYARGLHFRCSAIILYCYVVRARLQSLYIMYSRRSVADNVA